uniref:Uncharacterized protein n=1 Tax=Anguilla anguilla TaxID=7936 RepID=A0A0E9UTB4_ANGAN
MRKSSTFACHCTCTASRKPHNWHRRLCKNYNNKKCAEESVIQFMR